MSAAVIAPPSLPAPVETKNSDGTKTIVFFRFNEDGKKVKVTQKLRETVVANNIEANIASRREWSKYGLAKTDGPGVNKGTTDLEDDVQLKLFPKSAKPEKGGDSEKPVKKTAVLTGVRCRACGGSHFTHLCQYKDKLGGLPQEPALGSEPAAAGPGTGKYQPPSLSRGDLRGRPMEDRDEACTLRVSNLPEDITDGPLRELFGRVGRVARCHVVRDKITGQGRGFAFISYEVRSAAERAQQALNGRPIGHLVMRVEFSKK